MTKTARLIQAGRWMLEPLAAFGLGAAMNLGVSAAAYAGVISPVAIDPQWLALSGAAGGLVSALVHIGVVSLGAEPVSAREVVRACIEGLFAVFVGAMVAFFWAPQLLRFWPDAAPSDLRAAGFFIGMVAWRFAPGVFAGLKLAINPATVRDLILKLLTLRSAS